jgi:hypothetical protein
MMIELLPLVPVALAAGAAALAIWKTIVKIRARSDLSRVIRSNLNDVAELDRLLAVNNLDAAVEFARLRTIDLSAAEKSEVELALSQPSAVGRANYLRAVAHE